MTSFYQSLAEKIENRSFTMAVVGIGRVGLPLALSFASKGIKVLGVDRSRDYVATVNAGTLPFMEDGAAPLLEAALRNDSFEATTDSGSAISAADVIILTVGTPLAESLRADTSQLEQAIEEVGASLRPGTLVITRSTLSPGTTDRIVLPRLSQLSDLTLGESLFAAFCPERIAEGKAIEELETLPEIIGGADPMSAELAASVFRILNADKSIQITDPLSAELAKLFTNVYRYVTFALANEYALIAEHYRRDARHIISVLRDGYDRAPVPLPGPAGGPCLSKDGYFLIEELTFPDFVLTAWKLNDSVPTHLVNRLRQAMEQRGRTLAGSRVAVLGKAFKAEIDDDRLSPSLRVISGLESLGANVVVHDPYIGVTTIEEALKGADALVLATNHRAYFELLPHHVADLVAEDCLVVDAWGVFDPEAWAEAGIPVYTFGRA